MNNQLEQVKKALDEAIAQKKLSQELLKNLGPAIIETLTPVLNEIALNAKVSKQELIDAISQMNINVPKIEIPHSTVDVKIPEIKVPEVNVTVPEIKLPAFPEIKIPKITVPKPEVTVNVPPIKIPDLKWPEEEMPIKGWVSLMGVNMENPLPVQLRDSKGNPVSLFDKITTVGGGGGGKTDFFTIKGFSASAYTELMNADGRLKVSVETGGGSLTDTELRASSVPVEQVSGSVWSTYVSGAFGSTAVDSVWNSDNRLRVSVETGGSGLTDSELRASSVPVAQVSGAIWSTEANQAGTWNIGTVTTVTGVTNSISASLIDSSGVQYSGSNPVPISDAGGSLTIDGSVSVSGSISSTVVTGTTVSDVADDGSAPVKVGGIARTANPTAVSGGDTISASYDKIGRQLIRPHQVRDLISTARATLANGSETTLISGVAGTYLDCIAIMASNNSTVAVTLDVRAVTGGNIVQTIEIPANSTAGWAPPVPWPQDATGNNWTIDMGDITGTTISVSALFSKEI